MPDIPGIEVLAGLRGWLTAPVIVLSARTDSSDKVGALDAGADDYMTKPFGMDELLARLRAAVRRATAATGADNPVVETKSFLVDLASKKVIKNGAEVHLTPTEWGMLEVLVRNRGKLVSREELLKEVWGPTYATETHYLRVFLAQLRRKLEDDPSHPHHLLTEAGMGYRFEHDRSCQASRNFRRTAPGQSVGVDYCRTRTATRILAPPRAVDGITDRVRHALGIVFQPALGSLALKLGPRRHGEPFEEYVRLPETAKQPPTVATRAQP